MKKDADFKGAVPRDKGFKVTDSGGLHLFVSPGGGKSWRFKYNFGGKERRIVFGPYPDVPLKRAREMRDDAKRLLRDGRDPGLESKRARHTRKVGHENTFEMFARNWHEQQKDGWKEVHANDVITSMERDLFPSIGIFPVNEIDEGLLLSALWEVERRGAVETAHRLRQRAEKVFRFAAGAGAPNSNPAVNVRDALKPVPPKRRYPALTDVEQIRELIRSVDRAGVASDASVLALHVARGAAPGMSRNVEWTEIRGIDWAGENQDASGAEWCVPAHKIKQELGLRADEAFEHIVPLVPEAVEVLRGIRPLTGRGRLIFPSLSDRNEPISENAVGYLYNREGWKGRHVPHGWRSSFSTVMNKRVERVIPGAEKLMIDRLIIDMMLAHRPTGMSEAEFRYNRNAYPERRRELAEEWATLIMDGAEPISVAVTGPRRWRR